MPSLIEALSNPDAEKLPGPRCSLAPILDALTPDEAAALNRAMDDPAISAGVIAKILSDHGYKVGYHTIARHRRRARGAGCSCPVNA